MHQFLRVLLAALSVCFAFAPSARGAWNAVERNGRWTITRPDDSPILLMGLNHCGQGIPRDAGKRAIYLDGIRDTLTALAFNNLGYGSPSALHDTWPFIASTSLHSASHARDPSTFAYVDVFDPNVQAETKQKIRALCERNRDNPNLIGFYWTDTPRWDIDLARRLRGDDWVSAIRSLPAGSAGKKRYVAFLADRYENNPVAFTAATGHAINDFDDLRLYDFREFDRSHPVNRADDEAFLALIAREHYRVLGESFRKHAPGVLVFGERYKLHDHPEAVLREAAKWVDVLSIQPGPEIGPRPGAGRDERVFHRPTFDALHELMQKPILICDHKISFPTPERPVTLWHQAASEEEALAITAAYIEDALECPYIVGVQNCQYRDDFRPERGNMLKQGIMQEDGEPYRRSHEFLAEFNRRTQASWLEKLEGDASTGNK